MSPALPDLLDRIAEHFAIGFLSDLLQRIDPQMLVRGATVAELARASGADQGRLILGLRYAAQASDLIEEGHAGSFRFGEQHRSALCLFQLLKFLGAYGQTVDKAWTYWSGESSGRDADDRSLAAAYACLAGIRLTAVADIVDRLDARCLLELGCGSAPMLREMAARRPELRGWGVDRSPEMLELASGELAKAKLGARIQLRKGRLEDVVRGEVDLPGEIDVICMRGVLNTFFAEGDGKVVSLLDQTSRMFPSAYFVISDYYGTSLGEGEYGGGKLAMCQDFVQILSGQGVPPGRPDQWDSIYDAAGLKCIHRRLDHGLPGVTQFVDVVTVSDLR